MYLDENHAWVEALASAYLFQSLEEASAVAVKVNDPAQVIGIELVGVALQATNGSLAITEKPSAQMVRVSMFFPR